MICILCKRDVSDLYIQYHHLIPKSKHGKVTIPICESCHNFIHKTWTNKELRDSYNNIETIYNDGKYKKFYKWLLKQSLEKSHKTKRRNLL